MNVRCSAIALAAGSGRRMGAGPKKQYLELGGKPLVCHALQAFEDSFTENVVLVVPAEDIDYCRAEIVERYGFSKVRAVIAGGKERYDSVAAGLRWLDESWGTGTLTHFSSSGVQSSMLGEKRVSVPVPADSSPSTHLVFIHDGARPFVTQEMLKDLYDAAVVTGAAVAAMPVKNTIKVADENGYVISTPDRATLWEMQTPQVFEFGLIRDCYEKYLEEYVRSESTGTGTLTHFSLHDEQTSASEEKRVSVPVPLTHFTPTDDAQLVERYSDVRVKLVQTSYENLKITSPEDLIVAERLLR